MWLDEDRQVAAYGGIEPLLFGKLPDGIIEHYARLIGVTENPPLLDPVLAEIEEESGELKDYLDGLEHIARRLL